MSKEEKPTGYETHPVTSFPNSLVETLLSTPRQCPSPRLLKCWVYRLSSHSHTWEGSGTLSGPALDILGTGKLLSPGASLHFLGYMNFQFTNKLQLPSEVQLPISKTQKVRLVLALCG